MSALRYEQGLPLPSTCPPRNLDRAAEGRGLGDLDRRGRALADPADPHDRLGIGRSKGPKRQSPDQLLREALSSLRGNAKRGDIDQLMLEQGVGSAVEQPLSERARCPLPYALFTRLGRDREGRPEREC